MADTKLSDLTAVTDVLVDDLYLVARSGASRKITAANLAAGLDTGGRLFDAWAYLRDEKAQNTQGGTPVTAGTVGTRDLNTEVYDSAGIVTLSSNQFTLAAGTYVVKARAPFYQAERSVLRLRNVTDSSTVINGCGSFSTGSANDQAHAFLTGRFTIAGSKAFELQYIVGSTSGTTRGLGVEMNYSGITEVYAEVEIWREAA